MRTFDPAKATVLEVQNYLQGIIIPRPIAFVSTIDKNGNVNLSPFSFFNVFSLNPPVVVFSPSRRGRDNTLKHTYENIIEVPEAVINIVNFSMVQQASLASTEYPKGVNEFLKSGLTPEPSALVKPPRVKESPASMECSVKQVIPLGDQGAAGNLVLCEVLLIHIKEEVLDANNHVDPFKLDAVARLGGDWYCRVSADSIFKVPKPLLKRGIGVDQIPNSIRKSKILTGNDLGMLANVESLPDENSVLEFKKLPAVSQAIMSGQDAIDQLASEYLKKGQVESAWKALLAFHSSHTPAS